MTSLKSFAAWGWSEKVLEEYIAPTPSKTIAHPIPEGPDGLRRMIDVATTHEEKAIIGAGGFVGTRISETLDLRTGDFNLDNMTLSVRGKGDKTRVVPVSEEAWDYLVPAYVLALHKSDKKLISYKDRGGRAAVTRLARQAKLRRAVASHDLRATFATAMLDGGANIRVVQEILGHASVETTELYTGVTMGSMREAVNL